MTLYNYVSEMQELCFRATQALKVMGKTGTMDFYSAAENGFYQLLQELNNKPIEEVSTTVNQDQLDTLVSCKLFVEKQENEAAYFIRRQEINSNKRDA